jgi:hypothetical protein
VGLGLTLALMVGVAGSPFAQSGPREYGPGHGSGGHHRMSGRQALEGPPAPAILRDSIGVSGAQLDRYAKQYSSYMAQTKPARDSLQTTMKAMRAAYESGERSQAHSRHDAIERQSQDLTKKDKEFEKSLRDGLSKDQQKRYDQWEKSRQEADRQRHEHSQHPEPGNL